MFKRTHKTMIDQNTKLLRQFGWKIPIVNFDFLVIASSHTSDLVLA